MEKENNKIQDVSQNEQIIKREDLKLETPSKRPLYIRTLNVFVNPVRQRYEKHYKESKKHLIIDFVFIILILILIGINIILFNREFPIETIEININRAKVSGKSDEIIKPQPPVNTNLILNGSAVYYTPEGEQLGIGPWPPQINESTSVQINFDFYSTLRTANNVKFKAKLSAGITWNNKSVVNMGQAITYDESTNSIIWTADNLIAQEKVKLGFEIEFTPDENQVNNKIKLLENISVTGTDSLTGEFITVYNNDLYSPIVIE